MPEPVKIPSETPKKRSGKAISNPNNTNRLGDLPSAMVFLSPAIIGFAVFVLFPIVFSFFLAFTNWSLKPAITTEFRGLQNVWNLIGFRRKTPDLSNAQAIVSMLLFFSSWICSGVGIAWILTALSKEWNGLRACGYIGFLFSVVFICMSFSSEFGVNWALTGILLFFLSLFPALDERGELFGISVFGVVVFCLGVFGIYYTSDQFNTHWGALDPKFYQTLYNTFYLMIAVPIQLAGSLLLAILLSKPLIHQNLFTSLKLVGIFSVLFLIGTPFVWSMGKGDGVLLWGLFWGIAILGVTAGMVGYRTLFYLPSFTAGVAIMLLWKQILNPNFGLLNQVIAFVLEPFGVVSDDLPKWLLDSSWAKPALILMALWTYIGGANMLIFLAGLANIPGALYEAARIDGANRWQLFKHVTWPQLAPTTFFIVVMTTIAGVQGGFEQARIMTQGGPAGSTKTLAYYVYERAFEELDLGYASAIAWVIFIIIFGLTMINWTFGNQETND